MVHNKIKEFLESKGLEVIVKPTHGTMRFAKESDEDAKYLDFQGLYDKLYADMTQLDLSKKITIADYSYLAERTLDAISIELVLSEDKKFSEFIEISEDYYNTSSVKYSIQIKTKPCARLDEFLKSNDFIIKNYNAFENIFRKTLNPNNDKKLKETKYDEGEDRLRIRSYSEENNSDGIGISGDSKTKYYLYLCFNIDKNDKKKCSMQLQNAETY